MPTIGYIFTRRLIRCAHMLSGTGLFSFHELCFILWAQQQHCISFLCLLKLKDNEKVCCRSLRCDGTRRERRIEPEQEEISKMESEDKGVRRKIRNLD